MSWRNSKGFGLVEIMVALVLGLVISLGIMQIFVAARGTFASQASTARMQEDARFVLSKMVQELRMTGMYGCLGTGSYATVPVLPEISRALTVALDTPIFWDNSSKTLTIVTADIGSAGGTPTWTILSDCQTSSQLYSGARAAATGQTAFPLRQLVYVLDSSTNTLKIKAGALATAQPLLQNVSSLDVSFGVAGSPMSYTSTITVANAADIRSVRLVLTLSDPDNRVAAQTYSVVAYLRNRF